MTDSPFYCSAESRARDEGMFGTAARVDTWLLLEVPGAWGSNALPVDRLPDTVQRYFESMGQRVPRSRRLLIRQRHVRRATHRFYIVESRGSRATWEIPLAEYEDLLEVDAAVPARQAVPSEGSLAPEYLVCTHGRHDKCCAKFGFATYCALRDFAGESVWQCSHVGGDRFAANVIFLPHGIYYGHVLPEDVEELVDTGRRGQISLKHYRGRSSYSRPAQIGEYLVRKETGLTGLNDLRHIGSVQFDGDCWRVQFQGHGRHEVEFRVRANAFVELLTCSAREPAAVTQYELLRYRAE